MTLARQLLAGITAAFVALLIGIEAIYVSAARNHLEAQLDAHANETATALALSFGARASTIDESLANIMINPVFDRGHFDLIEVRSPRGARIFGRTLERTEIDVPGWFVALVPLEGPTGEALIASGWKQLGKVIVRVQPGYAYQQLYGTAMATLAWLGLLFALALVAMRYHLAGILRPLEKVEQAALAISERNFVSIDIEPRTRELQRVTLAINSLSAKVRDVISQESERAESLRKEAFEDPLTGQLNRRGLEQAVSAALDNRSEVHTGAFALFSISGLDEVNRQFGLTKGNEVLHQLASALAAPGEHGAAVVGRWQGPVLAAFIPNLAQQPAVAWADGLCRESSAHLKKKGMDAGVVLSCGLAHFSDGKTTLARLAHDAEGALADSTAKGGMVLAAGQGGAQARGADLKKEIEAAIGAGRITLLGQKVITIAEQDELQVELFSSLSGGDGKAIPASVFVPVASQHGLLAALDLKVIEQALAALARVASLPWTVSVNMSMQSISDGAFRAGLNELLKRHKPVARRLVFEVTGYAAGRSPDLIKAFSAEVHKAGVRVAFDNFDIDRNSMAIAHDLLPAYIKLAPAFTQQIAAREDLRFIVEAMVRMLRPLEIPLIAQAVEDTGTVAILGELGLVAYQGYVVGKPAPLPAS